MHAKLAHFPSLQSKLVWSKPRRLKSLSAERNNLNLIGEVQREREEF